MENYFVEEMESIIILASQIKDRSCKDPTIHADAILYWVRIFKDRLDNYHIIKKCRCFCNESECD